LIVLSDNAAVNLFAWRVVTALGNSRRALANQTLNWRLSP